MNILVRSIFVLALLVAPLFISMELHAQPLNETQKVQASDGETDDAFGVSVSISGDYAIVGASGYDLGEPGELELAAGAAYIFERDAMGDWIETQLLTDPDGDFIDFFGRSVSISGSYAIVGIPGELGRGAAYIYKRNDDGIWLEVQRLFPSDPDSHQDEFGQSVSISGDYALVGAPDDDESAVDGGAAYFYKRDAKGNWNEVQKVISSDGEFLGEFGNRVAICGTSGQAIIAEDRLSEDNPVYIYEMNRNGKWFEVQKLTGSNLGFGGDYGTSVSISNGIAAVGADSAFDPKQVTRPGAVYIYERPFFTSNSKEVWRESLKLYSSDMEDYGKFGQSVAIEGNILVVGASSSDVGELNGAGAGYVFEQRRSGKWVEKHRLTASDASTGELLGRSASISYGVVFLGALDGDGNENESGTAYFFELPELNNFEEYFEEYFIENR